MMNNKGFTLTEVLLAAMIVGIIGIALAALTTAALRESSVGRTRIMLRNQASLFLRQLRQDIREAKSIQVSANNKTLTIIKPGLAWGPDYTRADVTYTCNAQCKRGEEVVLEHVNTITDDDNAPLWKDPFSIKENPERLEVRLIVGMDANPPIKEAIKETFILPQSAN